MMNNSNNSTTTSIQDVQQPSDHQLRTQLAIKDQHIRLLNANAKSSEEMIAEWQTKYERLSESYRKQQQINRETEQKFVRIIDKYENDKSQFNRDLASQAQKLAQSKINLARLVEENRHLYNDLQISIGLLENRPANFLTRRVDSLPADMQKRVRSYLNDLRRNNCSVGNSQKEPNAGSNASEFGSGKRIQIPLPRTIDDKINGDIGESEKVSAAILAKVLEERAKDRRKINERILATDVSTQTDHFLVPMVLNNDPVPSDRKSFEHHDNEQEMENVNLSPSKNKSSMDEEVSEFSQVDHHKLNNAVCQESFAKFEEQEKDDGYENRTSQQQFIPIKPEPVSWFMANDNISEVEAQENSTPTMTSSVQQKGREIELPSGRGTTAAPMKLDNETVEGRNTGAAIHGKEDECMADNVVTDEQEGLQRVCNTEDLELTVTIDGQQQNRPDRNSSVDLIDCYTRLLSAQNTVNNANHGRQTGAVGVAAAAAAAILSADSSGRSSVVSSSNYSPSFSLMKKSFTFSAKQTEV